MAWCLVRDPAGCAFVELDRFVRPTDTIVQKFPSHREASDALRAFREAAEREALRAAGQGDLFA